mmetsp:Transcript_54594/g.150269  ORF Transcript_54594/g.150269 Transcript_54594/m.150269 type:complete len:470 (+) Transcript_54594:429-1838(+)
MGNTPTTASIIAIDKAVVLGLRNRDLLEITNDYPSVKESLMNTITVRLRQNISAIPFFSYIERRIIGKEFKMMGALDLMASLFEVEALDAKQTIFNEGDEADKLYIVCEGCVRISSKSSEDPDKDALLAMLTKDAVFGEIALLGSTTTRRTASAKTFAPSLLLSINKEKFGQILKVVPDFKQYIAPEVSLRTGNSLKTIALFKNLSTQQRDQLGCLLVFESYEAGSYLFKENDESNGLFILVNGEAEATASDGAVLSVMGSGSIIGEIALLTRGNRTATVKFTQLSRVLFLPTEQFRTNFLPIAPELMYEFRDKAKERRAASMEGGTSQESDIPDIDEVLMARRRRGSLMETSPAPDGRAIIPNIHAEEDEPDTSEDARRANAKRSLESQESVATITPREGCDVPTDNLAAADETAETPEQGAEMTSSPPTTANASDGSVSAKPTDPTPTVDGSVDGTAEVSRAETAVT